MIVEWADAPYPNPHEQVDAMREVLLRALEQRAEDVDRFVRAAGRGRGALGIQGRISTEPGQW